MDQWYKQPKGQRVHKDHSAILLDDPETPNRWEQIARELHELISENKTREFFQMTNRVTQIKNQAQPLKGLIEDDGTTIFEEEAIQKRLAHHYNSLSAKKHITEVSMLDESQN